VDAATLNQISSLIVKFPCVQDVIGMIR
jgi:hypothetical protein